MAGVAKRQPRAGQVLRALVVVVALGLFAANVSAQLLVDLSIAGLALGSIVALSGLGVVVTYKATGVFNFAHGAIASVVAYVLWQLTQVWHVPVGIAAPLTLLVVAPGLGALLERFVFRPLAARAASTSEQLVATIGVFIVALGAMVAIWGNEAKIDPVSLFPRNRLCFGACDPGAEGLAVRLSTEQLFVMLTLVVVGVALWWLLFRSRLGLDIKAVVDRRELAQLTAVDANRVSMVAWAIGASFAGLSGVLFASVQIGQLDPFRLTLLVVETFAVVVLARLSSLPRAIAAGIGLGFANQYLGVFDFGYVVDWVDRATPGALPGAAHAAQVLSDIGGPVITYLLVFVFLGVLVFQRRFDGDDGGGSLAQAFGGGASSRMLGSSNAVAVLVVSVIAVSLPFTVRGDVALMADAHRMLALSVVFLSIVVVTGFSGHITLAQAALAGVGGLVSVRMFDVGVPVIPAMLIGGIVCVPIGLAAAYPALKRKGLFLALTTLALGMALDRGVLGSLWFVGFASTVNVGAPSLFGLTFGGDVAFYFYELAIVVLMVLLARNVRRTRIGRVLGAMRDSEPGAQSVALNLRSYKVLVFCLGAFMAGIGGAMVTQASGTFSSEDFVTLNGLIWFAVVVVAGVNSIYGALLAAFLYTLLGSLLGESGLSTLIIGLAAVSLGRLPGGLVGSVRRLVLAGPALLLGREREPALPPRQLAPSEVAQRRLAAAREGS